MRYRDIRLLLEAKRLKLPTESGNEVLVWMNPSASELRNILARATNLRGISVPDAVFVWSADDGLHYMVLDLLVENSYLTDVGYDASFIMAPSSHGLSDFDHWQDEPIEINGVEYMANNEAIKTHAPFLRMIG